MSRTQELIEVATRKGKGSFEHRIKTHLSNLRQCSGVLRAHGLKDDSLQRDIRILDAALRRRT